MEFYAFLLFIFIGFIFQAGKAESEGRKNGKYWIGAAITFLIIVLAYIRDSQ